MEIDRRALRGLYPSDQSRIALVSLAGLVVNLRPHGFGDFDLRSRRGMGGHRPELAVAARRARGQRVGAPARARGALSVSGLTSAA